MSDPFADLFTYAKGVLAYARGARRQLIKVFSVWFTAFAVLTALPLTKPSLFPKFFTDPLSVANWLNHSVALWLFRRLEAYLLPSGETLIAQGPFDAFTSVMYVGAGLALVITVPYITYLLRRLMRVEAWDSKTQEVIVDSMFEEKTRRRIRNLLALAVTCFLGGVGVGLLILPSLYQFAYTFQLSAGVTGTITLSGFIMTTALFTVGLGLGFEVPTIAYALAITGVLSSKTLGAHRAEAALGSVLIAFVISPGVGGGIIEIPIAILLFGLYSVSFYIVRGVERRRVGTGEPTLMEAPREQA